MSDDTRAPGEEGGHAFFTPYFDNLAAEIPPLTALVFGLIWRYARMSDHVCRASSFTLAGRLGINRSTLLHALRRLVAAGLVEDLTPGARNRPHVLRPTRQALALIAGVAQNDTCMEDNRAGVVENNHRCGAEPPPGVAECDTNHTSLKKEERDNGELENSAAFYQDKVKYINGQILAFYRCKAIMDCRFHSFEGSRFVISHPDVSYLRVLAGLKHIYEQTLALFIPDPDLKVEFVLREPRWPR